MKRAIIFGVSGQDGAYLASLLLSKGYQVYGTSRDAQISSFKNLIRLEILDRVSLHSASLIDFRSIFNLLSKIKPDEVYNLSGQSSVGLSFEQPVETLESIVLGTLNILEAMRMLDMDIRFYNAASGECFGSTGDIAVDENAPFRPRSPYAVAKASAYWEVANYREAYGLFACSGILFNHESPLRPERFVTQKIIHSVSRIAIGQQDILSLGDLSIQRDWGWAPEYVEAMWLMLQRNSAEDYVIATGESSSLEDFVREAFRIKNLDWSKHVRNSADLVRPTEVLISKGNALKAKVNLGWNPKYKMRDVVRLMMESAV